jgi:hypothetical protein
MSIDPTKAPAAPTQYEFNDEQNGRISRLADSMRTVAGLLQILGLVFAIFFVMKLVYLLQIKDEGIRHLPAIAAIGMGSAMMLCLAMGLWTSWAAQEFRKVVETKGSDLWHLMNALRQLNHMYSLIQAIVYGSLVLAVVGLVLALVAQFK